jgi:hypothetical protein
MLGPMETIIALIALLLILSKCYSTPPSEW